MTHFKISRGFTSFHKLASRQKPEKQHATTDQSYPQMGANSDRRSMLPHVPIKVTPKHIQEVRFRKILSKVSVKFVFLSIKFAFNFFIYLFLVYRPLLTYSKATVGTLEQS